LDWEEKRKGERKEKKKSLTRGVYLSKTFKRKKRLEVRPENKRVKRGRGKRIESRGGGGGGLGFVCRRGKGFFMQGKVFRNNRGYKGCADGKTGRKRGSKGRIPPGIPVKKGIKGGDSVDQKKKSQKGGTRPQKERSLERKGLKSLMKTGKAQNLKGMKRKGVARPVFGFEVKDSDRECEEGVFSMWGGGGVSCGKACQQGKRVIKSKRLWKK